MTNVCHRRLRMCCVYFRFTNHTFAVCVVLLKNCYYWRTKLNFDSKGTTLIWEFLSLWTWSIKSISVQSNATNRQRLIVNFIWFQWLITTVDFLGFINALLLLLLAFLLQILCFVLKGNVLQQIYFSAVLSRFATAVFEIRCVALL